MNNFLPKKFITMLALLFISISCEDNNNILVTEKVVNMNNGKFQLTLKIDPDLAYLNSSTKVTATITRQTHKDSLADYVSMKMIMDAVGGTLDGHSFSLASNIVVSMKDSVSSTFEALAFFTPSYSYSTTSGYYNYKSNGHVSASFDGMNLSLPIKMVVPR
tara:strand:+ start:6820 stop:7302 length:483 start_codon:yes stop_codon:yes gene_type:complete